MSPHSNSPRRPMRLPALFSALLLPTVVMAQTPAPPSAVTLYGLLDLGLRQADGLTAAYSAATGRTTGLISGIDNTSRLGLRGAEDLGGDLKAVFQLETGVQAHNGAPINRSKFFDRAAWLGLQVGRGTWTAGRQTTVLADAVAMTEPLGMRLASFNPNINVTALSQHGLGQQFGNTGTPSGAFRLDQSLKYTVRAGPWTGRAMYGFGQQDAEHKGMGSVGLGLAYSTNAWVISGALQSFKSADHLKLNAASLGASHQWHSLKLVANLGRHTAETQPGRHTTQRVLSVGGTWSVSPVIDLTAAHYRVDRRRTGLGNDGYTRQVVFAEHKLSRRTRLYAELDLTRWHNGYAGATARPKATAWSAGWVQSF